METKPGFQWWQTGVLYQVYVRSFQDSNGDGIGDIKGIIQRLDYLQWLGIKGIWLTPVYISPMIDYGYDISDYKSISPQYGTMNDFMDLLQEVHSCDMKLIMDLVPNHTSDLHPWFIESKSSKDNPKRDWYIWKDAKEDGTTPNNWISNVGEDAWQWDEQTKQYYFHSFLKEQPDLNFRNEEVCNALFDVMRFWLDKGIDGFRVDSIAYPVKDRVFRNDLPNPDYRPGMPKVNKLTKVFSSNQPMVHDLIRKMRKVMDEYTDTVMIGEIYLSVSGTVAYYGMDDQEVQLPANYQLISSPWVANQLARIISASEANVPPLAWAHWALGNHDRKRLISRVGNDAAKTAAMLLLTIRGTPCMYYGDEIGMHDVLIPFEETRDTQGFFQPELHLSRDPARTPMQWNDSESAGFTTGKPWLRLSSNYEEINVEKSKEDKDSLLCFYQRLLQLRGKESSLATGEYIPVFADTNIIAYIRSQADADSFLILINTSTDKALYEQRDIKVKGKIVLATNSKREGNKIENIITLEASEGILVRLDKTVL